MEKPKINEFNKTLISRTLPTRLYFFELQDRFGQHLYSTFSEEESFSLPEAQKLFLYVYRKQIPIDKTRFRKWVGLITNIYIQNGIIVYQQSKNKDSLMYTLSPLWISNFEKMSGTSFSHFLKKSDQTQKSRRTKAIGTLGYMTFVQLKRGFTHRNEIAENTGFNKQRICVVLSIFKGSGIVKGGKEKRGTLIFRKKVVEILPYLSEYNKKAIKLRQQRRELIEKGNLLFQKLKERLKQEKELGVNSQHDVNKFQNKMKIIFKKRELFVTEVDFTPNLTESQPKKIKKMVITNKRNKKNKKKAKNDKKNKKKIKKEKKIGNKKKKRNNNKNFEINELATSDFDCKTQKNKNEDLTSNSNEKGNLKFSNQNPKNGKSIQQSLRSGGIKEVNIAQALLSLSPSPKPNPLTQIMNQTTTMNQKNPESTSLKIQTPEIPDFRKMENPSQSPFFYSISPIPYFPSSISPSGFATSLPNMENINLQGLQTPYFQPNEFWEIMMREWKNQQERSQQQTQPQSQQQTQPQSNLKQQQPQFQQQKLLQSLQQQSLQLKQQQQQQQQQRHQMEQIQQIKPQPQQLNQKVPSKETQPSQASLNLKLKTQTQPLERKYSPFQYQQQPLLSRENTQDPKHTKFRSPETSEPIDFMKVKQINKTNPEEINNNKPQINKEVEAKFIPNFSDKWFND
ncbi:zinc finger cchc domain-containing protein [Anaeramoeba flamelloides]|uniref:Zinc finger cchc domain-containing protein n=1 Tax=Anaeramoeba flamelloides TaxID=1746091 RepID=A0AAV8A3W6_9EUKA|nr:zinc finger cchc domain-containing protein [Anaeramoeba flamelloides]